MHCISQIIKNKNDGRARSSADVKYRYQQPHLHQINAISNIKIGDN